MSAVLHIGFLFWCVVGIVAAIVTLPGTLELLALSLASLLPETKRSASSFPAGDASTWRTAVVVPAHNESLSIAACVRTLLAVAIPNTTVYVIADNCTDNTAEVARTAGATVLERDNLTLRGKGYALDYAFNALATLGLQLAPDCVLVVDADTQVAPNFISASSATLCAGAAATQSRYLVANPEQNTRTRLMALALRAFNVVRPMGRERLGLSAGIFGNGFGLRRETLARVPYTAASVVEDLEYHLNLVHAGLRVVFLNQTTVFGEMPTGAEASKTQRSRWEGGRLRMAVEHAPALALDALKLRLTCLEPLLELCLLPLAFHVLLLLVAASTPLLPIRAIGLFGLATVLLHLVAAILSNRGANPGGAKSNSSIASDLAALASAPFYVLWKLLLIPTLLRSSRRSNDWVRTARNAEAPAREK
jgi:cellulose synthase/poly-beta-1,6-N-acetylglucosamine synthase-like glycosyltransferase